MPAFTFRCPDHGAFQRYLKTAVKTLPCPTCENDSKRIPKFAHATVMEVLDNGLMPQALERPQDTEELMQERRDLRRKLSEDTLLLSGNENQETDD